MRALLTPFWRRLLLLAFQAVRREAWKSGYHDDLVAGMGNIEREIADDWLSHLLRRFRR